MSIKTGFINTQPWILPLAKTSQQIQSGGDVIVATQLQLLLWPDQDLSQRFSSQNAMTGARGKKTERG